ncbi:hypothetical protein WKI72_07150 [Candidatus Erwinia dacicola]
MLLLQLNSGISLPSSNLCNSAFYLGHPLGEMRLVSRVFER